MSKPDLPDKTVTFSSSDPAPTLKSADGKSEFNVRGRVFVDWSAGSDDQGTFDISGTKLRAAWFGVEGKATDNIKYKFEADFGGNNVSVKDAYLQFKVQNWAYTIGQSKMPNSLEWNTAIRQTSLMERGAFKSAFGFGRGMGIKAETPGALPPEYSRVPIPFPATPKKAGPQQHESIMAANLITPPGLSGCLAGCVT